MNKPGGIRACEKVYAYTLHNEQKFVKSVVSGLDWARLASDPLSRTGLDQDHRLTDLDWTGFFQMNPFHTLPAPNSCLPPVRSPDRVFSPGYPAGLHPTCAALLVLNLTPSLHVVNVGFVCYTYMAIIKQETATNASPSRNVQVG